MSKTEKAEQRAFEAYPVHSVLVKPARGGGYFADNHLREGYIKGYHQAEKDLELTCGDIETILNAFLDFKIESVKSRETKKYTDEEYCQEVLKRFKERKEK